MKSSNTTPPWITENVPTHFRGMAIAELTKALQIVVAIKSVLEERRNRKLKSSNFYLFCFGGKINRSLKISSISVSKIEPRKICANSGYYF